MAWAVMWIIPWEPRKSFTCLARMDTSASLSLRGTRSVAGSRTRPTARVKFVAQLSLRQGESMPSVTPQPDDRLELCRTPNADLGPDQRLAVVHRTVSQEFVRFSVHGELGSGGRGGAGTTGEDGSEGGSQGGEDGRSDIAGRG